jgi:hypothetical protein
LLSLHEGAELRGSATIPPRAGRFNDTDHRFGNAGSVSGCEFHKIQSLVSRSFTAAYRRHQQRGQSQSGDGNYSRDNSDWWSILNPQHQDLTAKPERRVIAATNLSILGPSPMGHDRVDWLKQRRGKARVVTRGGGGATRSQYCCVSAGSHSVYLIAENGEVDLGGFACSLTARTGGGANSARRVR